MRAAGLGFVIVCVAAAPALAQTAPDAAAVTAAPRSMTLRECITYARAHQPSLAAARARVAVAREAAQLPRAAWSPRVVAGAEIVAGTNNNTTTSYGGPLGFDVPRIGGTSAYVGETWSPDASTFVGVGARQELYDFGRLSAQAAALDLFARAADEDAQLADLDLALYVENSFYAVSGAHAIVTASEAAVARSTSHRDLANAGVQAKLRPPMDLTRADADLARFEVDRVRARGALTSAQAVLAAAIGAPDAGIDAGLDDVAYAPAPSLDALDGELDRQAPEVRAARDSLDAQRAVTTSIERELLPDLSLSAGITGRAGGADVTTAGADNPYGDGFLPIVPNWDVMAVLSWPLFDRTVDVRAETSRRQEAVRVADLDTARERLRGIASKAIVDYQVAQSALPALQRSVDAATANQAQADARFANGLATAVELADAEALLTDAQIQLAIGQFQRSRTRAELARVADEGVK
nr:TolC family protein [Kofleriaceae bacterium]